MILPIPHEFAIGGVYMPPMLVAGAIAMIATLATSRLLDHYQWTRHFYYPPLVLLALMVIYTVVIGTFIIGA